MIEIISASPDDLDAVMAIENASFAHPKSRQSIDSELDRSVSRFYVARQKGVVAGFIIFWMVADEIELVDIAVDPRFRRQKIGLKLFQLMIDYGRRHGSKNIHLEVRLSNRGAVEFYRQSGFGEVGVRKGYYPDGEDAVMMALGL